MPIKRAGTTSNSETPTEPSILLANMETGATFSCFRSNIQLLGFRLSALSGRKLGYFTRLAQHLVYFAEVLFLFRNHFPRVLLQQNRSIAHEVEEFFI